MRGHPAPIFARASPRSGNHASSRTPRELPAPLQPEDPKKRPFHKCPSCEDTGYSLLAWDREVGFIQTRCRSCDMLKDRHGDDAFVAQLISGAIILAFFAVIAYFIRY